MNGDNNSLKTLGVMMRLMYGKPLGTCLMHSDAYLGAINYQLHLPQARGCRHSTEPSPPPGREAIWLQNSVPSSSLVRKSPSVPPALDGEKRPSKAGRAEPCPKPTKLTWSYSVARTKRFPLSICKIRVMVPSSPKVLPASLRRLVCKGLPPHEHRPEGLACAQQRGHLCSRGAPGLPLKPREISNFERQEEEV